MKQLRLSVIIVTWNGLKHLPECLAALKPQLPAHSEIVQVDNGSTDGTVEWVRQHHSDIRLITLRENIGFAGGVALGIRFARGELVFLLNDDAFVEPGCVEALVAALDPRPDLAAVGAVLTFAHQPQRVASAGIYIRRDGVALDRLTGCLVSELPQQPQEIMGPSAGAAIYRRAALEDVGGFEPGFFAYLEDVDLALRLQLRGWRSIVVPQARARHVYSATGGQSSPFKQRLLGRNRLRVLLRCIPRQLLFRFGILMLAYDTMAVGYAILTRQFSIVQGRLQALRELPMLLRQRHVVQARRTAPVPLVAQWFEEVPVPWKTLRAQRELDDFLRERKP
jgi:GT2 family glycosyltransferase